MIYSFDANYFVLLLTVVLKNSFQLLKNVLLYFPMLLGQFDENIHVWSQVF